MGGRALVLGSGGLTGIAWEIGVLHALDADGFDAEHWDLVVGSSAGAYVGAGLLLAGVEDLYAAEVGRDVATSQRELRAAIRGLPTALDLAHRGLPFAPKAWVVATGLRRVAGYSRSRGWGAARQAMNAIGALAGGEQLTPDGRRLMGSLAQAIGDDGGRWETYWRERLGVLGTSPRWPTTRLAVTAVDAGEGSQVILEAGSCSDLVAATSASTAIPMLIAPVQIDGRRLMDGGMVSSTNADLAVTLQPGVDEVLVIAPTDRGRLAAEVDALRGAGARVTVIRPKPTGSVLGEGIFTLDVRRCRASLDQGEADARAVPWRRDSA